MSYGDIIKGAWRITWRYKALWVLGLFAGVSGCQAGGSNSGGSGDIPGSSGPSDFGGGDLPSPADIAGLQDGLLIAAVVVGLLVLLGLVWFAVGTAARGGLVHAVNEIESGRTITLGAAWSRGWELWGRVFVFQLLLGLPVFLVAMLLLVAIFVPLIGPIMQGQEPSFEALGPMCGALVCLVPILILLAVAAELLSLVGLRYAVIGGRGAVDAIKAAYQAIRARIKDTALVYLISGGLNLAAGLVVAIPMVIIVLVTMLPAVGLLAVGDGSIAGFLGAVAFGVVLIVLVSLLYSAIWGTYTSAYWTIFFRKLTGLEPAPIVETAFAATPVPVDSAPLVEPAPPSEYPPAPAPPSDFPPAPPAPPSEYPPAPQPPGVSG